MAHFQHHRRIRSFASPRLPSLELCKSIDTKVTASGVAALQKALPNCKIEWDDPEQGAQPKLAYLDPAFQAWVKATQALPAEKQIEAVSKKLMELNPGFDGKVTDFNGTAAQDRKRRGHGVEFLHRQRDGHFAGASVRRN